jgi:hypothetical protein
MHNPRSQTCISVYPNMKNESFAFLVSEQLLFGCAKARSGGGRGEWRGVWGVGSVGGVGEGWFFVLV